MVIPAEIVRSHQSTLSSADLIHFEVGPGGQAVASLRDLLTFWYGNLFNLLIIVIRSVSENGRTQHIYWRVGFNLVHCVCELFNVIKGSFVSSRPSYKSYRIGLDKILAGTPRRYEFVVVRRALFVA